MLYVVFVSLIITAVKWEYKTYEFLNKPYFTLQSIIFIDSEGDTIQELAAIEIDSKSKEIKDSYLAFARNETDDSFSRLHVHGLSPFYLAEHGFSCEAELIKDFQSWIETKKL